MPETTKKDIEFNDRFLHALRVMGESDNNVFITGRAGTGKSTLLRYFRDSTDKNIAVLAPTGVAAINIQGQTIHSFFGFRVDVTPDSIRKIKPRDKDLYKKLDAIIIDEISMVRADLLDSVDAFLRKFGKKKGWPFGKIQMIFIGDLYQLPPVVTAREKALFKDHYRSPYFFSARIFDETLFSKIPNHSSNFDMEFIELEKVYRQKDAAFLNILNAIRNNSIEEDDIQVLNGHCDPGFKDRGENFYIYLTTTNALAEEVNSERLSSLKGDEHSYEGAVKGDFEKKALPTSMTLLVKKGAQVMMLNNDQLNRWVNGTIGKVVDIDESDDGDDVLWIELAGKEIVDVRPHEWEMYEFTYDKDSTSIVSESVGSFTQYPLRLAWAVTIHKSQGMTFDRTVIDIGRGTFSHGQLYVALSRCTTLGGLVLKRPVQKKHVLLDRRVVDFVTQYQYRQAEKQLSMDDRQSIVKEAIEKKKKLEIIYLKANDEKSKRTVLPIFIGQLEYRGRKFPGMKALCTSRQEERVFHMERILEIRTVD